MMVDGLQQYQELIGHLRLAIEIRTMDILLEMLLVLNHLTMPQVRHLEQAFHILGYSKGHPNRKLGCDPAHPAIDENRFQQYDWTDFYRDAKYSIQGNMPAARGKFMWTHCFVDVNPAGDTETRQSQTGILLF